MPNWCCATVEISATEKEIKRLKKAVKDGNKEKATKGLLNALVPQPVFEDDQEWYGWNIENWGCKWEIGNVNFNDETKTSLSLGFDTAWGPSLQAFQTWAEEDPDTREFIYKYYEPGMAFLGTATYQDGDFCEDYVSYQDDPERYKEIARDEWGDEPWDEEEESDYDTDEEVEDDDSDLAEALEQLKVELDNITVEQDPVLTMLREDFERLSERVKAYKEKINE